MKKVLVTGGTGFVGRHCLNPLKEKGYEVAVLALGAGQETDPDVQWIDYDLKETAGLDDILKDLQPTHLLHLAWNVTHGVFWTSPENKAWVDISRNLFEAFARHGGKRIVGAGTCAEYQWSDKPLHETNSPRVPSNPYGEAKKTVLGFCEDMSARGSMSYAWGRIFHLYGPGENPKRFIPSVIHAILNEDAELQTNDHFVRDFLYVADAGEAFVELLDSAVTGPVNIASGQPVRLGDVARTISATMNKTIAIRRRSQPPGPNDPKTIIAHVDRLNRELGWRPPTSLISGLEKTIQWCATQKTGEVR